MAAGNCSVEATIIESGKNVKGTLTLFIDEYSFGGKRTAINWEKATCMKGKIAVKGFLRSIDKPCITFAENGANSPQFILEQTQLNVIKDAIKVFATSIKEEREAKEAEKKRKEAERQCQIEEERRIREEAKRKADEEYRLKKEAEQRPKNEAERKVAEKKLESRKKLKIARIILHRKRSRSVLLQLRLADISSIILIEF